MNYMKMLGLVAVAAAAMMAFAGSASATVLCGVTPGAGAACASDLPSGTVLKAEMSSSGSLETTGGTTLVTCTGGKVEGKTTNVGSSTETVKGTISSLTWGGCTKEVKTLVTGESEAHHTTGTHNGVLTTKNTQVTVAGLFNNESCIYGAGSGTSAGTVVGGTPATLNVSALVPRQAGSGPFCPAETRVTGSYKVTSPATLFAGTS